jgi:hypothetical protein
MTRDTIAPVLLILVTFETTGPIICGGLLNISMSIVARQTGQGAVLEALASAQSHYLVSNVDSIVRISLGPAAMTRSAKRHQSLWLQASWILRLAVVVRVIQCAGMATFALHSWLERACRRHASGAVASKTLLDHVRRLSPTQRLSGGAGNTGGMTHREVEPISGGIIADAMLEENRSLKRDRCLGPAAGAEDPLDQSRRGLAAPLGDDLDGFALPLVSQQEAAARFTDGAVGKPFIEAASQDGLQGAGMRGCGVGHCLARMTNAALLRGNVSQRQERADQTRDAHNHAA